MWDCVSVDQHLIRQKKSDHMEDQNCLSLCLQPSMFNEFQVVLMHRPLVHQSMMEHVLCHQVIMEPESARCLVMQYFKCVAFLLLQAYLLQYQL